jgi:hypothetical protein
MNRVHEFAGFILTHFGYSLISLISLRVASCFPTQRCLGYKCCSASLLKSVAHAGTARI